MGAELIQVAFAGHNRLSDLGDPAQVTEGLRKAFGMIQSAAPDGSRLLTGLAQGADLAAAGLWRELAVGPIHAVHPFLATPAEQAASLLASSETWLDGAGLEAAGRNPHLAQSRWLIGAADLLVVVWTGEHARGAGGTADAVRLALEHNIPVLWVKPDHGDEVWLISPQHLDEDFGFLEFLEQLTAARAPLVSQASPEGLAQAQAQRAPAREDSEALNPPGIVDRLLHRTLWQTYARFRRLLGGRLEGGHPAPSPPEDLQALEGFRTLTMAMEEADTRANRMASAHRSQQILLLGAAILATAIGSAPAIWPEIKLAAVIGELTVALAALVVWLIVIRSDQHQRWSHARRLAEQLRLERASWALGVSTVGDRSQGPGDRGAAARIIRRRAGLASGAYTPERVEKWGNWAMDELVLGQARYHRGQGGLNHRVAHRIHLFEDISFAFFVLVLVGYVIAHMVIDEHVPHWAGGVVLMTGAIVPAIGAASLALEATLSFDEQGRRSDLLAQQLGAIAAELGETPRLDRLQRAAKAAIRLQTSQEDRWTDEAVRRRLFRVG